MIEGYRTLELAQRPTWLFARRIDHRGSPGRRRPQCHGAGLVERLVETTHARELKLFAGKLDLRKLGFAEKASVRMAHASEATTATGRRSTTGQPRSPSSSSRAASAPVALMHAPEAPAVHPRLRPAGGAGSSSRLPRAQPLARQKWPHNHSTHGVARAAKTAVSTALGRRSMVRMGPVVRATKDPPRSPRTSRHLTSPLTVPRDQQRCRLAWRLPPTRSHGGSQGFKSPHLHPTTALVTGLAGLLRRAGALLEPLPGQQTGSNRMGP